MTKRPTKQRAGPASPGSGGRSSAQGGAARPGPARFGSRPLADFIEPTLGPALAKRGFAAADILVSWPEIVGEDLALRCEPLRLAWAGRRTPLDEEVARPAVLHVRVDGGFALELQHRAPQIVERVNAYFGWRCVGRIAIEQGPLKRRPRPEPRRDPSPESKDTARRLVADVEDEGLRAALERLGAAVIDGRRS